jgi:hypothetical protein
VPRRNDTEADADGAADNMRAAVVETNTLNAVSQPLGYAVTCRASGAPEEQRPANRRFTVHRIDQPIAQGPSFESADDARNYLDELETLPRWRLDLNDDSVEFDSRALTVTDRRTGDSFCLKGWKSFGISGLIGDAIPGASAGTRHISVVAESPPTIGHWHRVDTR